MGASAPIFFGENMNIHFYKETFPMSYCITTTGYNSILNERNKIKNFPYRISFLTSDISIEHTIHKDLSKMRRSDYDITTKMLGYSLNYTVTVFFKTKNDMLRFKLKSSNV